MKNYIGLTLIALLLIFTSCDKDKVTAGDFGIFSSQDATTVIMNGVIGSKTPKHWENYIETFPNTNRMIMKDCPGSKDDTANLEAARSIRSQGVAIHLPADAEIASGAVDMFLAGTTRSREDGSRVGVHSWAGLFKTATDFPVGHENHQPYIDYYVEMGLSLEEAEAFYYFTINAAPANDIHWMTDEEIAEYKLLIE